MIEKAELEARRTRIKAEIDRRLEDLDAENVQYLVKRHIIWRRLAAIAVNEDEDAEVRLEAATRALDLMGATPRSAKFDYDLSELSLPELKNALGFVEAEIVRRGEAA
jgi:hypothetical protein